MSKQQNINHPYPWRILLFFSVSLLSLAILLFWIMGQKSVIIQDFDNPNSNTLFEPAYQAIQSRLNKVCEHDIILDRINKRLKDKQTITRKIKKQLKRNLFAHGFETFQLTYQGRFLTGSFRKTNAFQKTGLPTTTKILIKYQAKNNLLFHCQTTFLKDQPLQLFALIELESFLSSLGLGNNKTELEIGKVDGSERITTLIHSGKTLSLVSRQAKVKSYTFDIQKLVPIAAFLLFLIIIAAFLLRRHQTKQQKQLVSMTAFAKQLRSGDLESTIGIERRDELGMLKHELNQMAEQLAQEKIQKALEQKRALRAERVAAWHHVGRLVAHEIKNPLSPIQMSIETLQKAYRRNHPDFPQMLDESTKAIVEEVSRMKHLVNEFSSFARLPRPKVVDVHLSEIIKHITSMHADNTIEFQLSTPETRSIKADHDQLTQVVLNLVQNAIDAGKENASSENIAKENIDNPKTIVAISITETETGIEMNIEDNGNGIADDKIDTIFDPYMTTKKHGTGLGLAMVQRIIQDHDGQIDVSHGELGGAKFTIFLPFSGPHQDITKTVV